MSSNIVYAYIFLASLVSIVNLTGCTREEYEDVTLNLYSLILPGAIDTQREVTVKFTWEGGG
jgi:hypothetical protein